MMREGHISATRVFEIGEQNATTILMNFSMCHQVNPQSVLNFFRSLKLRPLQALYAYVVWIEEHPKSDFEDFLREKVTASRAH